MSVLLTLVCSDKMPPPAITWEQPIVDEIDESRYLSMQMIWIYLGSCHVVGLYIYTVSGAGQLSGLLP